MPNVTCGTCGEPVQVNQPHSHGEGMNNSMIVGYFVTWTDKDELHLHTDELEEPLIDWKKAPEGARYARPGVRVEPKKPLGVYLEWVELDEQVQER